MPYDEVLDARIRKAIARWKGAGSRKMFGGVCHLLSGNMLCGVYKDRLILRLPQEKAEDVLKLKHARPFDITGRPMKGWVMLSPEAFGSDEELKKWLGMCRDYVRTLPPK